MIVKKIGLIINPYAGLGGKVGLKGTDGLETVLEALSLGSVAMAETRTHLALSEIRSSSHVVIYTASANMGANLCQELKLNHHIIYQSSELETCANDSIKTAQKLLDLNVDLIIFAGGDGTARDIQTIITDRIPMIGIPCGVKMYSGVFALNPRHAGILINTFINNEKNDIKETEILDINENYLRADCPTTQLYGYAKTLLDRRIQSSKGSKKSQPTDHLDAICYDNSKLLFSSEVVNIVGPGSTMKKLMDYANIEGTLLGVDVIKEGKIIIKDANEQQILNIIQDVPTKIFVGVIGGTGCLFGRGNQQISAKVIDLVGKANIKVICTMDKILSLENNEFFVDTGCCEVDQKLSGFIKVQVEKNNFMLVGIKC
ncbi:NAD(+)/NADH kinase [Acinetobacter bereziniae]|uniref:ATP-NAD kinase family protein n=1 Tax=Acinetobacter TaxID=469 RepID=UPI0002AE9164|nr:MULTISPECIES: NAD(+)/NADH kinase [Acinetobacter]ELW79499.1 NAD(+)/NADH kinase [Acinetobacter sp. WC-743]MBJ8428670.1 NAD(+)/NADH kinase [Acinetobacter bereziniae]MBJ8477658.1 NAD(+)/NADH kinase [Acinetobacter bereziniae]MBJ9947757.1 NAD(+)/NADH kinase [Acinetobacter bereziniae]MCU4473566.1 NAD(+)/NADH kinase [Acinetobacter bereziniae]